MTELRPRHATTVVLGCLTGWVAVLLASAAVGVAAACLLLFFLQYLGEAPELQQLLSEPLHPLLVGVRLGVGGTIAGRDASPLVAAGLVLLLYFFVALLLSLLRSGGHTGTRRAASSSLLRKPPTSAVGSDAATPPAVADQAALLARITKARQNLENTAGPHREAARQAIQGAIDELAAQKKRLAFLSIAVENGSLLSDHGTAPELLAFRQWADGFFRSHGVYLRTWTAEEGIAAFHSIDAAAGAARAILSRLPEFNTHSLRAASPLRVRLGVSMGEVIFPPGADLKEVADPVIDLASRLRECADPDALLMAERHVRSLGDDRGFTPVQREVDGHLVAQWRAR
ncbi:MAG: hypothetical protein QHJ73_11450 [Armatimonadota bacterium]|nr:hypothetical protein [Armatimonadota bacterium]